MAEAVHKIWMVYLAYFKTLGGAAVSLKTTYLVLVRDRGRSAGLLPLKT